MTEEPKLYIRKPDVEATASWRVYVPFPSGAVIEVKFVAVGPEEDVIPYVRHLQDHLMKEAWLVEYPKDGAND